MSTIEPYAEAQYAEVQRRWKLGETVSLEPKPEWSVEAQDFRPRADLKTVGVVFRYSLQQDVKITSLKLSGRIVGRGERVGGHVYLVVWWAENKRNEQWLYEHELEG